MKKTLVNPYILMKGLKAQGQKFTLSKTLYTMEIVCKYGVFKWVSKESNIPRNELYFIKMVKDDIEKRNVYCPPVEISEIKYFDLPVNEFTVTDCYEVDISGAYWNLAKPFLSEAVFLKGLSMDKVTRLASLGNLAKTKTVLDYNGKEFQYAKTVIEETRNIFFRCAYETGEIMDRLRMVCDTSIFFWVDAVFFQSEKDMNYIFSVLDLYGLTGKVFKCEKIVSDKNKITVFSSEHKRKERVFFKQRINSDFFIEKFKHGTTKKTVENLQDKASE